MAPESSPLNLRSQCTRRALNFVYTFRKRLKKEGAMYRMKLFVLLAVTAASATMLAQTATVTVFEGARLIIGDGRSIENATFIVSGNHFTQVGRAGDVKVPAGAKRINLAGKTVMPMIIDTHTHLSQ